MQNKGEMKRTTRLKGCLSTCYTPSPSLYCTNIRHNRAFCSTTSKHDVLFTERQRNASRGALMGVLVGDAMGGVLEFLEPPSYPAVWLTIGRCLFAPWGWKRDLPTLLNQIRYISYDRPSAIKHAMSLPGGGVMALAPGQITDDGEMTLSLATALAEATANSPTKPPTIPDLLDSIAEHYLRWASSMPIDIGATTKNAICNISGVDRNPFEEEEEERKKEKEKEKEKEKKRKLRIGQRMLVSAYHQGSGSLANGSLMRCIPWAIYGRRLSIDDLAMAVAAECRLTHPRQLCQDATIAYVAIAQWLINHPDDRSRRRDAFDRALEYTRSQKRETAYTIAGWMESAAAAAIDKSKKERPLALGYPMGHVGVAFSHAIEHLIKGSSYTDAIQDVLMQGGDTDTNAAITGGLIGAAEGVEGMDGKVVDIVMKCKPWGRPEWLYGGRGMDIADTLLAVSPASLSSPSSNSTCNNNDDISEVMCSSTPFLPPLSLDNFK